MIMSENNAVIKAFEIEGTGKGTQLYGAAIAETIKSNALAWVHLDGNKPETRDWMKNEIGYLDSMIIDALLAEETRPRIMEIEEGTLLILRGVNLNENAAPEDMISIRMWVDASRIITVERRPLKAVKDLQDLLENNKGPKNAGDFITMLSTRLFARMESTFSLLDENLDDLEEAVLEDPDISERQKITEIRKQAIMFRRYIAPQKDVMVFLRASDQPWLDQSHKRRLQESLDRVTRYVEDLDAIRERAQIVKDELSSVLADQLNKNMYVLSVIAAVFLPLGFLTGLMGINIGGMPGVENANAFWIFSGALTILIILQVIIFKKLKWF
jgi:zinc transporter